MPLFWAVLGGSTPFWDFFPRKNIALPGEAYFRPPLHEGSGVRLFQVSFQTAKIIGTGSFGGPLFRIALTWFLPRGTFWPFGRGPGKTTASSTGSGQRDVSAIARIPS